MLEVFKGFFIKGNFSFVVFCVGSLFIFVGKVYLYLINIHTFIHTLFFCTVGRCKCWMVCFFFWAQTCSLIIVFGQFGWSREGPGLVRLV